MKTLSASGRPENQTVGKPDREPECLNLMSPKAKPEPKKERSTAS
jgi:hypothetical protein